MAEKRDNKEAIYKREVYKIPLQDEKRCLYTPNLCGKGTAKYKEKSKNLGDIHEEYTEKVVIYRTHTYTDLQEEKDDYTCEVCSVVCSGFENFKRHIDGKKHKKKLNIVEEMNSIPEMAHVTTNIGKEQKITVRQEYVPLTSKHANREIMTLEYLNILDLARHLEHGSCTKLPIHYDAFKNRPKSQKLYYLQHLDIYEHYEKDKRMKNITIGSEGGLKFNCEICSKEFTGIVPYNQHLLSTCHIKKENINKLQKIRNVTLSSEMFCEECEMKFSGIIPFNNHIKGSSHLRLQKKKELLAKLKKQHSELLHPICTDDIKEEEAVGGVIFSKTNYSENNCRCGKQREFLENNYRIRNLNRMSSMEDFREDCFLQVSDSDDSSDDVLLKL